MKIFSLLFGSERVKENVIVSAKHHESKVCDFFSLLNRFLSSHIKVIIGY